jgi:hypothetical protein
MGPRLCDGGLARTDPQGLHRARRTAGDSEHDDRQRPFSARDGEGRPDVRPDLLR